MPRIYKSVLAFKRLRNGYWGSETIRKKFKPLHRYPGSSCYFGLAFRRLTAPFKYIQC